MDENINVGLIGYGMAGRIFHAPLITSVQGFTLSKIKESRKEYSDIARARYPSVEIVSGAQEILDDATIDLVIVATPNGSHFTLTKAALLAGKHVVTEKPFTVSSAEADELIETATSQKKLLTIFQNRRWDSDFRTVKKVIESHLLGNIVELESHYDRFRNVPKKDAWREENTPGSGILYDLGSHLIDQALCLFGVPQEIFAETSIQRKDATSTDHFELLLFYENLKVTLKAGMLVREQCYDILVFGDKGSFLKKRSNVQEEALKAGHIPLSNADWGLEPKDIWGTINTECNGLQMIGTIESERGDYRKFYENVHNATLGKEELIVTPQQARTTIRIIELAMKSNTEKRRVPFIQ